MSRVEKIQISFYLVMMFLNCVAYPVLYYYQTELYEDMNEQGLYLWLMMLFSSLMLLICRILQIFCSINEVFPRSYKQLMALKVVLIKIYQHYDEYVGMDDDHRIMSEDILFRQFVEILVKRRKENEAKYNDKKDEREPVRELKEVARKIEKKFNIAKVISKGNERIRRSSLL